MPETDLEEIALRTLIVDDEPDILAVTRLGLKSLRWRGNKIKFLAAASGAEAIEVMRANPDVAVVLLDVRGAGETDPGGSRGRLTSRQLRRRMLGKRCSSRASGKSRL